jgi:hypothetical protein
METIRKTEVRAVPHSEAANDLLGRGEGWELYACVTSSLGITWEPVYVLIRREQNAGAE